MEEWFPVERYEGIYWISNKGRIRNKKGQIMRPVDNGKGYLRYNLFRHKGRGKTEYAHRLIAEAFIPNPNGLPEINHKDENKKNNDINNLEWCSHKYNQGYGTLPSKTSARMSKGVLGVKATTGERLYLPKIADAGRHGLNRTAIGNCLHGRARSSGGYIWAYA